jgi:hypothetical protein
MERRPMMQDLSGMIEKVPHVGPALTPQNRVARTERQDDQHASEANQSRWPELGHPPRSRPFGDCRRKPGHESNQTYNGNCHCNEDDDTT